MTKLSEKGTVKWLKILPKRQEDSNGGREQLSFKHINTDSDLYLYYMDHKENLELEEGEPETYRNGDDGHLVAYKVAYEDGGIDQYPLFHLENADGSEIHYFDPNYIFKTAEDQVCFEATKKTKGNIFRRIFVGKKELMFGVEF